MWVWAYALIEITKKFEVAHFEELPPQSMFFLSDVYLLKTRLLKITNKNITLVSQLLTQENFQAVF